MTLGALGTLRKAVAQQITAEDQHTQRFESQFDDDHVAPFFDWQEFVSWMLPTAPGDAILYYNPAILRTPVCRERALADFKQRHPGIIPKVEPLFPNDLKHFSISRYPLADQVFHQRGYVSNIDFTNEPGNSHESPYVKQSKAAVRLQYMMLDAMLSEFPGLDGGTLPLDPTRTLEALSGKRCNASVPLVEHEDLLLGCTDFGQQRRVHMAFEFNSQKGLNEAKRDPMGLMYAMPDELYEQISFELVHSRELFNGASPLAIVTWHSQVLAYLRKWAWTKRFLEKNLTGYHFDEVDHLTNRVRKPTEDDFVAGLDDAVRKAFNDATNEYNEKCKNTANGMVGNPTYSMRLWEHEKWIAMLHGSMFQGWEFDRREGYQSNDLYHLRPLTVWIGELKRKRCAVLNDVISPIFELFQGSSEDFSDFAEQLSFEALESLRDRALLIEENASPVHVVYEWTRDAEQPRSIDVIHGVLVIRGPLLTFPLRASRYWNERAEVIRRNGGFELAPQVSVAGGRPKAAARAPERTPRVASASGS